MLFYGNHAASKKEKAMTADKFRNISTMFAALFVSGLLIAATTSMPIVA